MGHVGPGSAHYQSLGGIMRKVAGLKMTLRGSVLVLLLGAIAALVAACGSDPTPTPVPTPTPDPDTVVPEWQQEYNKVLEAAHAEGEVVIVMGGSASRNFALRFSP